jgi:hypothetical protein
MGKKAATKKRGARAATAASVVVTPNAKAIRSPSQV